MQQLENAYICFLEQLWTNSVPVTPFLIAAHM